MKIYIVGTGGVGGYFGGLLAKAGNDVTFVARGNNYKVIKEKGLQIRSKKSGNFLIKPIKIIDDIKKIQNPEIIILTVKTYDNESVGKDLANVVIGQTSVITFQNGIENDLFLKKFIKEGNTYPGVAYVISEKTSPGVISQTAGLCKLIFGSRDNKTTGVLRDLETIMKNSGIDATLSDDIERDLWKKFTVISAFGGITAITRSTIQKVLKDKTTREIYKRCIKESISVAKALRVNLSDDIFEYAMKVSEATDKNSKSSLLLDIENGRKTEIETLNGTIVKYASKFNIDVPINKTLYSAIKLLS